MSKSVDERIRGNLGSGVLLKDTSTCWLEELDIKPTTF